ncbi:hypothetical protein DICSQDRAFT_140593 [Dichomitus squalens LYAD-421 SS1]|uniref:Uncharacterized protein n=1 Tax=Dichomitus squalens (strain LYAD-421) TaxID=732165 RepID=R7SMN1_DICSQ|nr:uncharacterized protein DICSQDRAFT_140593 [Dichomitus squalens LYAD-421 SS1]EJF57148.1 hypothetical protein DICSQDRAFT_140593 [Dichomitus squalens LYAD-421 SS1]
MWDWEIAQDDWWKTSFRAISWAYKTKPSHPRPPHYHDHLARGRRKTIAGDAQGAARGAAGDVSLNNGLCGVRVAEEALMRYEVDAAILPSNDHFQIAEVPSPDPDPLYADGIWDEKVQELLGGILEPGALLEVDSLAQDVPLWDLHLLDSPLLAPSSSGAADLTDSETSVDSDPPPSTPKPTKASYARIVSSDMVSPTVLSPLPSKLLSAAALTFIPSTPNRASSREPTTPPLTSSSNSSDSPFSSPTYNFHFPSLNSSSPADRRESRSLPPSLQKDESGFYIEVAEDLEEAAAGSTQSLGNTRSTTPRRPSAAFLPAFLTDGSPTSRSRNSKTREIVDRLRSSGSSTSSGRKAKKSSSNRRQASTSKDADLAELVPDASTEDSTDGWISGVVRQSSSSRLAVTDDGWVIQGMQQQTQQQTTQTPSRASSAAQQQYQSKSGKHGHGHGHKRSSGSNAAYPPSASSSTFSPASSTMSLTVPQTPASGPAQLPPMPQLFPGAPAGAPPYVPMGVYPGPYPGTFMHAGQMQQQQFPQTARGPWPMGSMGYQPGMYPMYQPFGVMPTAVPYGMMPVAPPGGMFFDGKGKPAGGALVQ